MIRLAFPEYAVFFFLVAVVVWLAILLMKDRDIRLRALGDYALLQRLIPGNQALVFRRKLILLVAASVFFTLALLGVEVGSKYEKVTIEGVDVVIALDISTSMNAQDVRPSRLEKAKHKINSLLAQLSGDRVGLVIFSGDAFIQCPLTTDFSAVKMFLEAIEPDVTTSAGTNLESALATSREVFNQLRDQTAGGSYGRAVILLSDGEDHGSDYETEAGKMKGKNVIVYTIGVGTDHGAPIPIVNENRTVVEFKKAGGSVVTSRLDESKLRAIAEQTGGHYYTATNSDEDIKKLYDDLSKLQKSESSQYQFTEYENRFQFFLIIGLALLVVEFLLSSRRKAPTP